MKLSETVKPISYIKSHASEIISEISESGSPVVVTVNGEARVIIQDIKEYERQGEHGVAEDAGNGKKRYA